MKNLMASTADGSQTNIMAYNPFLVIDGVGYKTEYEPCEALNAYANRLLNSENVTVILEDVMRDFSFYKVL